MRITEEERKKKHGFITDFWNVMKEYDRPEDNDEYWQGLIDSTDAMIQKYGTDDRMYLSLCVALLEAKQEQFKKEAQQDD